MVPAYSMLDDATVSAESPSMNRLAAVNQRGVSVQECPAGAKRAAE